MANSYMRAFKGHGSEDELAQILAEAQAMSSGEGDYSDDGGGIEDDTEGPPDPTWFGKMDEFGRAYGGVKKQLDIAEGPAAPPPKFPRYAEPEEKLPNRKAVVGMDFAAAVAHILANRRRRKHGQRTTPMQLPVGTIALGRREREHKANVADVQAKNKALEAEEARLGHQAGKERAGRVSTGAARAIPGIVESLKGPKEKGDTEATRSRDALLADIDRQAGAGLMTAEEARRAKRKAYGLEDNPEIEKAVAAGMPREEAENKWIEKFTRGAEGGDSVDPETRAFLTMKGQHRGRQAGFDKPENFLDILYRERQHLRGDMVLSMEPDKLEARAVENAVRIAKMNDVPLPPSLQVQEPNPPQESVSTGPFGTVFGGSSSAAPGIPPPTAAPPQVGAPPGRDFATEGHLRHEGGQVIFPDQAAAPAPPPPRHPELPPQARQSLPPQELTAAARNAKKKADAHPDEAGGIYADFQAQYGQDALAILGLR